MANFFLQLKSILIGLAILVSPLGGHSPMPVILSESTPPITPYTETAKEFISGKQSAIPNGGETRNVISKAEPEVRLEKWNGEADLAISYQGVKGIGERSPLNPKEIEWREKQEEVHAYPLAASAGVGEDGGFEIEVYLKERSATNVFNFQLSNYEDLDFFYQSSLWQEAGLKAPNAECTDTDCVTSEGQSHRPENVVGSYAVYHKTLRDYHIGGTNYATGKVYHIFRPKAIDAVGAESWAKLNYANGVLSITVPQSFLDSAVYPVTVDPTFGYTTAGGSSISITCGGDRGSVYNSYTASAGDTITQFSSYNGGGTYEMAAYSIVSGKPLTRLGTATTITESGLQWHNVAVSQAMSAGTTYNVAIASATGVTVYYDVKAGTNRYGEAVCSLPATWAGNDSSGATYSMYATYTASAPAAVSTIPQFLIKIGKIIFRGGKIIIRKQ